MNAPLHELTQTPEEMFNRIGHVTRSLHENLRSLGFDKIVQQVASEIPDTRDRLNYVAKMTEQAAGKVLDATDKASPLQDEIVQKGAELELLWKDVVVKPSVKSEYNEAAKKTVEFIKLTTNNAELTKALLMEIMMSQDFQDLTGQVIKKITSIAQQIEGDLVKLLVDFSPPTHKKTDDSLLNGPQIKPEATPNVMATQEDVDNLLDSYGF